MPELVISNYQSLCPVVEKMLFSVGEAVPSAINQSGGRVYVPPQLYHLLKLHDSCRVSSPDPLKRISLSDKVVEVADLSTIPSNATFVVHPTILLTRMSYEEQIGMVGRGVNIIDTHCKYLGDCTVKKTREEEAYRIIDSVDMLLVIGDKQDPCTTSLYNWVCGEAKGKIYLIKTPEEAKTVDYSKAGKVGVISSPLIPSGVLDKVMEVVLGEELEERA